MVIPYPATNSSGKEITKYQIDGNSVSDYFDNIFDRLIPLVKTWVFEGVELDRDEKYDRVYGYDRTYGYDRIDKQKLISETSIQPEMRLSNLITKITRERPLGYCLARAKQLLDTSLLRDNTGLSHICNPDFLKFDRTSKSALPSAGESLEVNPGLVALSNLFYDTILYGTPKVTIGNDTLPKYIDFMKSMAYLFDDPLKSNDGSKLSKSKLSDIRNKRDSTLCKTRGDIIVPKETTENVITIVKELYRIQAEHNSNAGKILSLLFDIKTDKSSGLVQIQINPNVLRNGIPEINRINDLTRNMLVEYYKSCEYSYRQGMEYIIKSTTPKPVAPPASAPPMPGAAPKPL